MQGGEYFHKDKFVIQSNVMLEKRSLPIACSGFDFYGLIDKNLGFFIYVCNLVSFTEFMNGIENKIKSLREELEQHNYRYYVLSMPTISDKQYDEMMKELQLLEEQHPEFFDPHSPTQRVGSDLSKEFEQVPHRYPMLSLGNTYSREEVRDFYERTARTLNEPFEIVAELKYDGTSISLIYEDGRLMQAVTRGDGIRGDDVTANVRTIRSIPLKLHGKDYPQRFEIRGEIVLPWTEFERLNKEREAQEEPLFANPRNAASGTLKQQNPQIYLR